jgi:hypothetical protein
MFSFDVEDPGEQAVPTDAALDSGLIAEESFPFAFRCVVNDVPTDINDHIQFYLDVGGAMLDPRVVQLSLRWSQAANYYAQDWFAQPCLGQSTRSFHAEPFADQRFELWLAAGTVPATVNYEITAASETGPLGQPMQGTLELPGDCVPPTELGLAWQRFDFSVMCEEGSPSVESDGPTIYPELAMTESGGDCFDGTGPATLLEQSPPPEPEPEPLLVEPTSTPPDDDGALGIAETSPTSPAITTPAPLQHDAALPANGGSCTVGSRALAPGPRLLDVLVVLVAGLVLRRRDFDRLPGRHSGRPVRAPPFSCPFGWP